ncbi:MAG: thiamine pyrophosphate-dependent enzyme [Nitrospirota bacterium]|nr:thiamine pyrophosphate-dependent enzyme [Nitrospirota bacterium]
MAEFDVHINTDLIRSGAMPSPFCAGCGHGILMGTILRAINEMTDANGKPLSMDDFLFVSGIGCAGWIVSPHFNADTMHTTHGRPIAFATGAKLANPKLKVVVISGDGDLSAIGGNHLIHAARRNIDLTVICANNEIYGMTGGQVSPATPETKRTTTTPVGNPDRAFDICKLVEAAGADFVARWSVHQARPLVKSIRKAINHNGFSFIEVMSPCPTHYGRLNALGEPFDLIDDLKKRSVPVQKAENMTAEELDGRIVTGQIKEP